MSERSTVSLEKSGRRLYFAGNTYPHRDTLRGAGATWDADRKQWWIGSSRAAQAETLVARLNGVPEAASVGLSSDVPPEALADRLEQEGRTDDARAVRDRIAAPKPQEDPSGVRLTGKGTYQGRTYYVGATTRDGQRVRILQVPGPDGRYFDRWVPVAEVEITKTYQPRQVWDGRRYSGQTRTVYTTLGSIADFVSRQRDGERQGLPACAACGKRSADLVEDLEDGLRKCRRCCDIPGD